MVSATMMNNGDLPESSATGAYAIEGEEMTPERAKALMVEGKREYLLASWHKACEKLSDACEMSVALYGQNAPECFEPHLYYGKSLLELARLEPGVFSNALTGAEEALADSDDGESDTEEDDDKEEPSDEQKEKEDGKEQFESVDALTEAERAEIHDEVEAAFDENADLLADRKAMEEFIEGKTGDDGTAGTEDTLEEEDAKEEEVDKDAEQSLTEDDTGETTKAEKSMDEDADVTNLQLAWEVLEVARRVCDQNEGMEWMEKKIAVLLVLGELSIQDENYKQAVDDLTLCLQLQNNLLPSHDRRIAECQFQIAEAYKLANEFVNAAEHYTAAVEVIKRRIEFVKTEMTNNSENEAEAKSELNDLETLLPDMSARILDAEESGKQWEATAGANAADTAPSSATNEPAPPAKDISALVRKSVKRTAEPESTADETQKRAKSEDNAANQQPADSTIE